MGKKGGGWGRKDESLRRWGFVRESCGECVDCFWKDQSGTGADDGAFILFPFRLLSQEIGMNGGKASP